MSDPLPELVSFSGGRTSARMLKQRLDREGGRLPPHVHVCFANTGREDEKTLRFVHDCAVHWGVSIVWLQFLPWERGAAWEDRFEIVGFNSAARAGEPFEALIRRKRFLPNSVSRFCTTALKIETMKHYMLSLGFDRWINHVGLRADEPARLARGAARNVSAKDRWRSEYPLAAAGITQRDVLEFWFGQHLSDMANIDWDYLLALPPAALPQGFDLGLRPFEGNCDGCFLKARGKLFEAERNRPGTLRWWSEMERLASTLASKESGARFVTEWSYAELIAAVARSPDLFAGLFDSDLIEQDAECGVWCGGV